MAHDLALDELPSGASKVPTRMRDDAALVDDALAELAEAHAARGQTGV